MSRSAQVRSIDALRVFGAALRSFGEEAAKHALEGGLKEAAAQLEAQDQVLLAARQEAVQLLRRRRQKCDGCEPQSAGTPPQGDPTERRGELVGTARDQLRALYAQAIPRLFEGNGPLGVVFLAILGAVVPALFIAGWAGWYWIPVSGAAAVFLALALLRWLYRVAGRQSAECYVTLLQTLADAEFARRAAVQAAEARWDRQSAAINAQLNAELEKAAETYSRASADLAAQRQEALAKAGEEFAALRAAAIARHNGELGELEERYARRVEEMEARFQGESSGLTQGYASAMAARKARFQHDWEAMAARWLGGIQRVQATVEELNRTCDRLFPDWRAAAWDRWTPATAIPPAIPFGRVEIKLSDLEGGVPDDRRLTPPRTEFSIPVLFPFRDRSLLMLKAGGDGRPSAVAALQAVMLRMLTAFPPGKVRFLIVDSPAAAQLGVHRAIFDDEGEGRLEKFRPYAPPAGDWLDWVKRQLHGRRNP